MKHAPTQHVHVQMINGLSGPGSIVDNRPVASGFKLPFACQLGGYREKTAEHRAVGVVRVLQ